MAQPRASSTEAVLEAALGVFLEKGFRAATIDDIARAAGISKPTVYQYVRSKQWLLEEIVDVMCRTMERAELEIHSAPAPAGVRIHWLIRQHILLALRYRESFELTLSEQSTLEPAARKRFRRWAHETTSRFTDLLGECRDEGAFRWSGDIAVGANLILTTLNSTYRWFHEGHPSGITADGLAANIRELLSGVLEPCDLEAWPYPEVSIEPARDSLTLEAQAG